MRYTASVNLVGLPWYATGGQNRQDGESSMVFSIVLIQSTSVPHGQTDRQN